MSWGPKWTETPDGWVIGVDREAGYLRRAAFVMRVARRFPNGVVEQYGPGGVAKSLQPNESPDPTEDLKPLEWVIPEGAVDAIVTALKGEGPPQLDNTLTNRLLDTLEDTLMVERARVDKLLDVSIQPQTLIVNESDAVAQGLTGKRKR